MNNRVLVIAEAGVNHNGCLVTARKMVEEAAHAGADIIKFQTYTSNNLVTKLAQKAEYQKSGGDDSESQLDMLKKFELSPEMHSELKDLCTINNIEFLSTAFDITNLNFLINCGIGRIKVPSGEITNYPFLKQIGSMDMPVILSTGMSFLNEVDVAIKVLVSSGLSKDKLTLLHCVSEYPAPINEVNLRAMETMRREFDVNVGFSDHTVGIEIGLAAVAMGAKVIEKHFTLNKFMEGPDHKSSIGVDELRLLVSGVRNIESAMGDGIKKPCISEYKNREIVRKSIVAKKTISPGDQFSEFNLTTKRPGNGISPMGWEAILQKKATRSYQEDELIKE